MWRRGSGMLPGAIAGMIALLTIVVSGLPVQASVNAPTHSCGNDGEQIQVAEQRFFDAHGRFAPLEDLTFDVPRPVDYTVKLWLGARVYLLTPVKGKGCDLPSDPAQRWAAQAGRFCGGVQSAVFGLKGSVLRGHEQNMTPARSAEFYRRGAALARELQKRLQALSPPAAYAAQYRTAVKAFDEYIALLDDLARSRPTDFASTNAVDNRHPGVYERFVAAWEPLVDQLGGQLQGCQYIGFKPGSGD